MNLLLPLFFSNEQQQLARPSVDRAKARSAAAQDRNLAQPKSPPNRPSSARLRQPNVSSCPTLALCTVGPARFGPIHVFFRETILLII